MSHILSPVDSIEALNFRALPSRKKVALVAGTRVGRTHVFLAAGGNIYSTQVQDKLAYTVGSRMEDTLQGCKVLGVLSAKAVAEHTKLSAAIRAKEDRRWAASGLKQNVATLGLRLTAAQKAAIAKAEGA